MEDILLPEPMIPYSSKIGNILSNLQNKKFLNERNTWLNNYFDELIRLNYDKIVKDFLEYTFRYSQAISSIILDTIYRNAGNACIYTTSLNGQLEAEDENDISFWNKISEEYSESSFWSYNLGSYKKPKIDKSIGFYGISLDLLDFLLESLVLDRSLLHITDDIFTDKSKKFIRALESYCARENLHTSFKERVTKETVYLNYCVSWSDEDDVRELPEAWKYHFKNASNERV